MIQEKHRQLLRAGGASEDKENDATAVRGEDDPVIAAGIDSQARFGEEEEGDLGGGGAISEDQLADMSFNTPTGPYGDHDFAQVWSSPSSVYRGLSPPPLDSPDSALDPPDIIDVMQGPRSILNPVYQALPYPVAITNPKLHDFLSQWPIPIPDIIANPASILPESYGFRSRPLRPETSFVDLYLNVHAATLSALQVPRAVVEFSLKTSIRFAQLMIDTCRPTALRPSGETPMPIGNGQLPTISEPDASDALSDILQETVVTLRSVERRLGLEVPIICHPVCPDSDCHEVFYDLLTMDQAKMGLPTNCPNCGGNLRENGSVDANLICKWFNRIPLKYELERIFAYPGVESEFFDWKRRKRAAFRTDNLPSGIKIFAEQFDGDYWQSLLDSHGNRLSDDDADVAHFNFSIDWFNANSGLHTRAYSMGPLVLELADLPPSLRARQPLLACVGITPGPEEPKAANLWKFTLPLFLELRQAWEHPVLIRTPSRPEGRLLRFALCAIVCDRPAAISTIGGPSQSSPGSVCTRCWATKDGLLQDQRQ